MFDKAALKRGGTPSLDIHGQKLLIYGRVVISILYLLLCGQIRLLTAVVMLLMADFVIRWIWWGSNYFSWNLKHDMEWYLVCMLVADKLSWSILKCFDPMIRS